MSDWIQNDFFPAPRPIVDEEYESTLPVPGKTPTTRGRDYIDIDSEYLGNLSEYLWDMPALAYSPGVNDFVASQPFPLNLISRGVVGLGDAALRAMVLGLEAPPALAGSIGGNMPGDARKARQARRGVGAAMEFGEILPVLGLPAMPVRAASGYAANAARNDARQLVGGLRQAYRGRGIKNSRHVGTPPVSAPLPAN